MQHFDEDMGELFRKASADIRLKPADDDWEKILGSLLPDGTVLSAIKVKGNNRNAIRFLMVVFFIFGVTAITAIVMTNQKTKKIESGLQPGIAQDGRSAKRSANENSQNGQKTRSRPILQSFIPVIEKIPPTKEPLNTKDLKEMAPVARETLIRPEPNGAMDPAIGIYDFKPETTNSKKLAKQTKIQRDQAAGKGIYGGITAGPQFSQTKQQGFGNAGLSAGLIAGFQINKKLAIETGFVISDKQFSSSGQYFDMSKISASMPSGMKLIRIQSNTTVLEIPLALKFDLIKISRGNLFATGGFSSYVITSESNQYKVSVNGIDETMEGNYQLHQNYFAAAAKIGAGYEWKGGKGLKLRLEPYLQIPLRTIGMGSMHVISMGVYLGITFPIIK